MKTPVKIYTQILDAGAAPIGIEEGSPAFGRVTFPLPRLENHKSREGKYPYPFANSFNAVCTTTARPSL